MWITMSSSNTKSFLASFLIWMLFLPVSCLTALAGTSSTLLYKSAESGYPCFAKNFQVRTLSFTVKYNVGESFYFFLFFEQICLIKLRKCSVPIF